MPPIGGGSVLIFKQFFERISIIKLIFQVLCTVRRWHCDKTRLHNQNVEICPQKNDFHDSHIQQEYRWGTKSINRDWYVTISWLICNHELTIVTYYRKSFKKKSMNEWPIIDYFMTRFNPQLTIFDYFMTRNRGLTYFSAWRRRKNEDDRRNPVNQIYTSLGRDRFLSTRFHR